jgi:protein-L-isoaspartate(D-aspartate) O-methyltransferase
MVPPSADSYGSHPEEASWAALRRLMVEQQLRQRGIRDLRVLSAMSRVPREEFVARAERPRAYDDAALEIHHGQTISQPFTVAFMLDALKLAGHEKVLEIGAGSGYGAAVLSLLAREVHTVERIAELAAECRERLQRLDYSNVAVHVADGTLGWPRDAPYDGIVVTAGAPALPVPYVEQLSPGGRIVIPIGTHPSSQQMRRYTLTDRGLQEDDLGAFAFVPLVGHFGWRENNTA